ncbi:MAG: futalosine hydrolase [Desulfovibrio sp.]|nr:futalosine hydrolase [Desulfovibrio sp.]
MALLLVTATAEELLALFPEKYRPAAETLKEQVPQPVPRGFFPDKYQVFSCLTGTGPVNAALATGLALGFLSSNGIQLEQVLLTGLAGAYDLARIPLCSLCLVREEIWPEYGLNDGNAVIAQAFKWPQWKTGPYGPVFDRIPLDCAQSFALTPKVIDKNFLLCSSLTVAGVSASFERARTLWDRYHADLENMEGFSVAYACARLGIACTEIRCVSNKTGPRRPEEKDFSGALGRLEEVFSLLHLV